MKPEPVEDMLPFMLWAGVGSELLTRGDVVGLKGSSFVPGEVCEGLCGVCG